MNEKIKLTTKEILLFLADSLMVAAKPFDRHGLYRKDISAYFKWRDLDKKRFSDNIKRLEKEKIIKIYFENKESVVELTKKGKGKVFDILENENKYQIPKIWDCKWRLIIFDVPDEAKNKRDGFRNQLKNIGFYQLQESVFVFPFDCLEYINYLKDRYYIRQYVQYVVADSIETEVNLIGKFMEMGLLKTSMIQKITM